MNISTSSFRRFFILIAVMFIASLSYAKPVTDTIKFGGSSGNNYVPKTLTVHIGDTILFRGAFASHPLTTDEIPPGAMRFDHDAGTSFAYVVKVAGVYNYHCGFHGQNDGTGMAGTFTVDLLGVEDNTPNNTLSVTNYPNPFSVKTTIQINLKEQTKGTVSVSDMNGNTVSTIYSGILSVGKSEYAFDASSLATGTYFYKVTTDNGTLIKQMEVIR